jgi:hypothetical protein
MIVLRHDLPIKETRGLGRSSGLLFFTDAVLSIFRAKGILHSRP